MEQGARQARPEADVPARAQTRLHPSGGRTRGRDRSRAPVGAQPLSRRAGFTADARCLIRRGAFACSRSTGTEPSPIRPHLSPARFSEHASTSGYLRQLNWTHGTLSVWGTATPSDTSRPPLHPSATLDFRSAIG